MGCNSSKGASAIPPLAATNALPLPNQQKYASEKVKLPTTQLQNNTIESVKTANTSVTNNHIPRCIRVTGRLKTPNSFCLNETNSKEVEIWTCKQVLGSGATASVFIAVNDEGDKSAVKIISLDSSASPSIQKALKRELNALSVLVPHKNVVSYFGAVKSNSKQCWYLFSELCSGGDLRSYYKKNQPFTAEQVSLLMWDILQGITHLHSQKLIHRDLKGANVLLDKDGIAKIVDFGASASVHETRQTSIGTLFWMAPEILSGQGHRESADIWSLGCVCMELATSQIPFQHVAPSPKHLCEFILQRYSVNEAIPNTITDAGCQSFIKACLIIAKEQRPTAESLLEHSFVSKWKNIPVSAVMEKRKHFVSNFPVFS